MSSEKTQTLKPIVAMSKTQAVGQALTTLAKELGPGGRLPTVDQLRSSLGVSSATLDRAMSELERHGVLRRQHGKGIFASETIDQKNIGVLLGRDLLRGNISPIYAMLLDGLRHRSERNGFDLQLYVDPPHGPNVNFARKHLEDDIRTRQIHGLFLMASQGPEQFAWLKAQGLPFVSTASEIEGGWRVIHDRDQLIELAISALVDQGCSRIGLMGHFERRLLQYHGENRSLVTFRDHLAKFDLPFNERWCHLIERDAHEWIQPGAASLEELGYAGMKQLLSEARAGEQADRFDGLVILDDMLTRGAVVALTRAGLRPGVDLHIATHANTGSPALLGYEEDLLRIEHDPDEFADAMLNMLEMLMRGQTPPVNPIVLRPRVAEKEA